MKTDDGICEYISRAARAELVELLVQKLGSITKLAAEVGVTEMAIRKWLSRVTHPSNARLEKIIELALVIGAPQTNEILQKDFLNFSEKCRLRTPEEHPPVATQQV